jgi:hypothetical protein
MNHINRATRITFKRPFSPIIVGGIALLTFSASCAAPGSPGAGTGSGTGAATEKVIVRQSAEIGAAWIDSHVPPDVNAEASEMASLLSDYQKLKTAKDPVSVALAILGILGFPGSSSSNVSALIQKVMAAIQTEYTGLAWQADTIEWGNLEGDVAGPISLAQAYYNVNGDNGQAACPLPDLNNCGTAQAIGTIQTLKTDYNVVFGRPYNASAVAGSWQQVLAATRDSQTGAITKVLSSPVMPGTSWVFDWRVGIPALAQFLSEFVQIYPLTDPNFQQDNTWDTTLGGLQDVRTWLESIYTAIAQGVHVDYMCSYFHNGSFGNSQAWPVYCDGKHYPGLFAPPRGGTVSLTPESPYPLATGWSATVAAADINTGIQAATSMTVGGNCMTGLNIQESSSLGTTDNHFLVPTQSCVSDLENNALSLVYSKLPLADLRRTIESLAVMQGTSVDFSQMPAGTITDCQAVADQYRIVQGSTWGAAPPALQAQWQQSGCSAGATALALPWSFRSRRAVDFDGDGKADLAVYRPDDSGWRPLSGNAVGLPSIQASPQYATAYGNFYVTNSGSGSSSSTGRWVGNVVPVPGYYEGPGRAILKAVWRPTDGYWIFTDSSGKAHSTDWGATGDIPLPADYDGDGIDDLMVYRPSEGNWYLLPSRSPLGTSTPYSYNPPTVTQWGWPDDVPVPADYNGDGATELAIWRPSEGNWYVPGSLPVTWGQAGDIPVPGNYDGTGTEMAIFRPSEGKWYVLSHDQSYGYWVGWGQRGDIPVPGDYDGDGITDFAVFTPSTATWSWISSSNWGGNSKQFGETGDVPIP